LSLRKNNIAIFCCRFEKGDNPRLRWYRRQIKELKNSEEEEATGLSDEEWEELSDEETIGTLPNLPAVIRI